MMGEVLRELVKLLANNKQFKLDKSEINETNITGTAYIHIDNHRRTFIYSRAGQKWVEKIRPAGPTRKL